jgi:hypothetical protein
MNGFKIFLCENFRPPRFVPLLRSLERNLFALEEPPLAFPGAMQGTLCTLGVSRQDFRLNNAMTSFTTRTY